MHVFLSILMGKIMASFESIAFCFISCKISMTDECGWSTSKTSCFCFWFSVPKYSIFLTSALLYVPVCVCVCMYEMGYRVKNGTQVKTSLNKQQCEIKTLIHKIDNRSNVSIDIRSVELLPLLHVRTPNSFVMRRFRFALMNNRYFSCAWIVYPD